MDRLWKEEETPKKLKGKKKKKRNPPLRTLRDERRVEQHRAYAEELVARLEAERVERAGEEEDDTIETEKVRVDERKESRAVRRPSERTSAERANEAVRIARFSSNPYS